MLNSEKCLICNKKLDNNIAQIVIIQGDGSLCGNLL